MMRRKEPSSTENVAPYRAPAVPRVDDPFQRIVGESGELFKAVGVARRLAGVDAPVLIEGETGVGKDIFARAIHQAGPHAGAPFVAVNCGGLPRELLASELFGYIDGAFTGARRGGMAGKLEAADGGTLFLDEIGEMPLDLQPFMLRALEENEICRLGENRARPVHFRLVAACNRDLRTEAANGNFRSDLYFRISVTILRVPPLRDHIGDLPALVEHFATNVASRHGHRPKSFAPDTLAALARYPWPGNIRELRNVVEASAILTEESVVSPNDLPRDVMPALEPSSEPPPPASERGLSQVERDAIARALETERGNLTRVARELKIARSTLYAKIKKYMLSSLLREVRVHGRSRADGS